jgi:hypothetical protein
MMFDAEVQAGQVIPYQHALQQWLIDASPRY